MGTSLSSSSSLPCYCCCTEGPMVVYKPPHLRTMTSSSCQSKKGSAPHSTPAVVSYDQQQSSWLPVTAASSAMLTSAVVSNGMRSEQAISTRSSVGSAVVLLDAAPGVAKLQLLGQSASATGPRAYTLNLAPATAAPTTAPPLHDTSSSGRNDDGSVLMSSEYPAELLLRLKNDAWQQPRLNTKNT